MNKWFKCLIFLALVVSCKNGDTDVSEIKSSEKSSNLYYCNADTSGYPSNIDLNERISSFLDYFPCKAGYGLPKKIYKLKFGLESAQTGTEISDLNSLDVDVDSDIYAGVNYVDKSIALIISNNGSVEDLYLFICPDSGDMLHGIRVENLKADKLLKLNQGCYINQASSLEFDLFKIPSGGIPKLIKAKFISPGSMCNYLYVCENE